MPPPNYNIEIKSQPKFDGISLPALEEMAELVVDVCRSKNLFDRINIQSFDVRSLHIIHQKYPQITLSFLAVNLKSVEENLKNLGFTPPLSVRTIKRSLRK
jgi:glycerophosphoryl diester phosphodiesterase